MHSSIHDDQPLAFDMLPEDLDAIRASRDVSSEALLTSPAPAVDWALHKASGGAPKAGAFAIRNHAFEAGAPKAGAFAIRNHAFEAGAPRAGAFAIRNHAFGT